MDPIIASIIFGAAIAGFVQGLSGFAFSMVAMAVWAWTLDPRLATSIAVFGGMIGQILAAMTFRGGFDRQVLIPLFVGALAGIPAGVAILPHLDTDLFKVLLGSTLTICCPIMLAAPGMPQISIRGRTINGLVGGVAGALSGIGGFSGIFPTLWYTLSGFDKLRLRMVIQYFNLAVLTTTLTIYVATGITTAEMLPTFAIVLPAMIVPWWLGSRLYIGISEAVFRRVVLGFLTLTGIAMVASSLPKAIEHLY